MLRNLLFIAVVLAQSINASSLPENMIESTKLFEDGKKFHRTKANSPIYLEAGTVTVSLKEFCYSKDSEVISKHEKQKLIRNGFKIKTIKDDTEVGFAVMWPMGYILHVSWFGIDEAHRRKGYAEQAIMTIEGIAKAHKAQMGVDYVLFNVSEDNAAMTALLRKNSYEEKQKDKAIYFRKLIATK